MEHHKTTQSHANGTTMGRFPRLTPVRLGPQVPDHMTVSESMYLFDGFGLGLGWDELLLEVGLELYPCPVGNGVG